MCLAHDLLTAVRHPIETFLDETQNLKASFDGADLQALETARKLLLAALPSVQLDLRFPIQEWAIQNVNRERTESELDAIVEAMSATTQVNGAEYEVVIDMTKAPIPPVSPQQMEMGLRDLFDGHLVVAGYNSIAQGNPPTIGTTQKRKYKGKIGRNPREIDDILTAVTTNGTGHYNAAHAANVANFQNKISPGVAGGASYCHRFHIKFTHKELKEDFLAWALAKPAATTDTLYSYPWWNELHAGGAQTIDLTPVIGTSLHLPGIAPHWF
eukprot:TRINITY_DN66929_c1_g1_i1.p1 TRINITY_DN66929_c1_g1~~TRINITY_DN66929_c1_g1_i1.p1  ORF type:complete len:270 (-),score=11.21 TRINITY_DN66929_c1_g1_i1:200-1009(-)